MMFNYFSISFLVQNCLYLILIIKVPVRVTFYMKKILWNSIMLCYLPNAVNPHYLWFLDLQFYSLAKIYVKPPNVSSKHAERKESFELPLGACISSGGWTRPHSIFLFQLSYCTQVFSWQFTYCFLCCVLVILLFKVALLCSTEVMCY